LVVEHEICVWIPCFQRFDRLFVVVVQDDQVDIISKPNLDTGVALDGGKHRCQ